MGIGSSSKYNSRLIELRRSHYLRGLYGELFTGLNQNLAIEILSYLSLWDLIQTRGTNLTGYQLVSNHQFRQFIFREMKSESVDNLNSSFAHCLLLKNIPKIEFLFNFHPKINSISLDRINIISCRIIGEIFFTRLFEIQALKHIQLSNTQISSNWCSIIIRECCSNNNLELLNLENNSVQDNDAILFSKYLRTNKSVKLLNLSYNRLEIKGEIALAVCLLENSTLTRLDIRNVKDDISYKVINHFMKALTQNKTIMKIDLRIACSQVFKQYILRKCRVLNQFGNRVLYGLDARNKFSLYY